MVKAALRPQTRVAPPPSFTPVTGGLLQRKCACGGTPGPTGECESCRKKKLQRRPGNLAAPSSIHHPPFSVSEVPPIVQEVLRSPGQPLDADTRAFMEPRFGNKLSSAHLRRIESVAALQISRPKDAFEMEADQLAGQVMGIPMEAAITNSSPRFDFGQVRVHSDARAARSAKAINARAYTVGSDIIFGDREYSPQTDAGRYLLAHELAHVEQQSKGQPRLQRWAIHDCTVSQQEDLNDALGRASTDLALVLPPLSQRPVPDNVRNALWLAFRDDSDSSADLTRGRIRRLAQRITGMHLQCREEATDAGCVRPFLARAPIGEEGVVTICRPQFFANEMSVFTQSEAVIHEAAHMYLGLPDRSYFARPGNLCAETPGETGTAGRNPAHRVDNADSYGCLVHYLRYLPTGALQSRSSAYRGEDLTLGLVDDIFAELHTQTPTPQLHRYRIDGLPPASGFRFRWRLETGGSVYYPTPTRRINADAAAFSPDNREVYISAGIRELLERNAVRQATLVCEIELFEPGGDRAPPVVRRTLSLQVVVGRPPADL